MGSSQTKTRANVRRASCLDNVPPHLGTNGTRAAYPPLFSLLDYLTFYWAMVMKKTTWPMALVVACVCATNVTLADPPRPVLEDGLRTLVPTVPQQDRRPAEGSRPEDQWRLNRPESDSQPMASFVGFDQGQRCGNSIGCQPGTVADDKAPIAKDEGVASVAMGDPTIADFEIMPNPRMIRLMGKRAGVTDLAITTDDNEVYNFEIHVGYDLELLRARLQQIFPDALIKLGQIREHLVVEGQARSPAQVTQILDTIRAFLGSVITPQKTTECARGPGWDARSWFPPASGRF